MSGIIMRFARVACIQVDTHQIELFFQIKMFVCHNAAMIFFRNQRQ